MRPSFLILGALAIATAAAAETGAPSLKVFGAFTPGLWQPEGRDADSRAAVGAKPICLAAPAALIRDGASPADGCGYTVIENADASATVTYACKVTGGGRTTLRIVDGHYRVEAQGFRNREPFETTVTYTRVGDCTAK